MAKEYSKKYNKYGKNNYNCSMLSKIHITKHSLERFRQRSLSFKTPHEKLLLRMIHLVQKSKLVGFQPDGHELREINGFIFICETIGFQTTVITTLLSKCRQMQYFSDDFSLETLDYEMLDMSPKCA